VRKRESERGRVREREREREKVREKEGERKGERCIVVIELTGAFCIF
jgi:hypothetical protein